MNVAESGSFADRAHPAVRGSPVEALPVASAQDRPIVAFTDREINRPSGPRSQRDRRRLVARAEDPQGAVSSLEPEIFHVGGAGVADPLPVEPEQHRQRSMVAVVLFGGEQEHPEL